MRISSTVYYQQAVASIDGAQSQIATLQNQLSSGLRIQTAEDDPIGAGQILNINKAISDNAQWQTNVTTLQNRLGLADTTLSGVTQALNRIQTLAIEANSGSLTDANRKSIAVEMQQNLNQLLTLANAQDGQGNYLFGGTQNQIAPFTLTPGGVVYNGNSNASMMPVGAFSQIQDTDPGDSVFMNLKSGDGTIDVSASATNSGTGAISSAAVTDPTQWTGGSYTISFLGGSYTVTDGLGATVANGPYTPGTAIQFDGASVTFSGTPADGDTFTLGPSQAQSLFTTVQNLINVLTVPNAQGPQNQTAVYSAMSALQTAQNHITGVSGGVGAREKTLTDISSQLASFATQLQSRLSDVQSTDFAAATTQLSQQKTILQAAEQTYVAVQGLSLFNYLR
jgi:flagellar hook-associated protein 3 FlgL